MSAEGHCCRMARIETPMPPGQLLSFISATAYPGLSDKVPGA